MKYFLYENGVLKPNYKGFIELDISTIKLNIFLGNSSKRYIAKSIYNKIAKILEERFLFIDASHNHRTHGARLSQLWRRNNSHKKHN